jgi:uncharacterized protein (DUF433 family)
MADQKAKRAVSFRFDPRTVRHLKRRAEEIGVPQATLAERYIEEGLRMDEHPSITFREGAAGRRPALLGTRLDVATVIETIRQHDGSIEETAEYLDVPIGRVEECLRYYVDYKTEVDEWVRRARRDAERERELWLRRQDALVE